MADAQQNNGQEKMAFELVSPERLLLSQQVTMAVLPGVDGFFGVMKGHVPIIAALGKGVIEVYQQDKISERIFVMGGFAEIDFERCMVLVEHAVSVDTLNTDELLQKFSDITEDWEDAKSDVERHLLEGQLDILRGKLTAVGAPGF
jgi:F-type H+-transporting ATPase subunit epsilon